MPVLTRFFAFTLLPAGAIVALCYFAVFGSSGWLHAQRIEAELSAANRHRDEIDADVARLQREVDQLRNDEATLRRAAAEDLLLVPKGSTVYRFADPNSALAVANGSGAGSLF